MAVTQVSVVAFTLVCISALVSADPNPAPGPLPPIDHAAQAKDVLGEAEKNKICANAGPLCTQAGPADPTCTKIAKEAGGATDATCSTAKVCSFTVAKPVQHPDAPGKAYVTEGAQPDHGVIFPCKTGGLVISVPKSEIGGSPGVQAPTPAPGAPAPAPGAPAPGAPAPGAPAPGAPAPVSPTPGSPPQ